MNSTENGKIAFLHAFYYLQGIFLQENWVGRSCLYKHCDEKYVEDGKKKLQEE